MVELEGMDLSSSETCPLSLAREITPRSDKLRSQGRGELLVSLCHQVTFFQRQHWSRWRCLIIEFLIQPAASRVTVVVLKARNLPKMDITGLSGLDNIILYYIICYIIYIILPKMDITGPSGLNIHSYCISWGRSMLTTINIFIILL